MAEEFDVQARISAAIDRNASSDPKARLEAAMDRNRGVDPSARIAAAMDRNRSIDPSGRIEAALDRNRSFNPSESITTQQERYLDSASLKKSRLLQQSLSKKELLPEVAESKKRALEEYRALRRDETYIPDRSLGEIAGDSAAALGVGVVQVADTGFTIGNVMNLGLPGKAFKALDPENKAYSQRSEQLKNSLRGLYSNKTKAQEIQRGLLEGRELEKNEAIDNKALKFGADVLTSAKSFATRPGLAINTALESLPQMFIPGGIAKAGVGKLSGAVISKMTTKMQARLVAKYGERGATEAAKKLATKKATEFTKKYLQSKAGQAQIKSIQSKAGIGYIAASEGISNGLQVHAEILNATEAELFESSPLYSELRDSGKTHDQAQTALADKAALITTGIAGLFGGVAAKVTGTGRAQGSFFKLDSLLGRSILEKVSKSGAGKIAGGTVGGAVREGAEELLQGGSGAFAANVGKAQTVNPEQDLGEGIAQSAGQGLAIGAYSGGGIAGVAQTGSALRQTAQLSIETAKKTAEVGGAVYRAGKKAAAGARVLKEAVKEGVDVIKDDIADTESPTIIEKVKTTLDSVIEGAKTTSEAIKQELRVQRAISSKDEATLAEIVDTESDNYNSRDAVTVLLHPDRRPPADATPEMINSYLAEVNRHIGIESEKIHQEYLDTLTAVQVAQESGNKEAIKTAARALEIVTRKRAATLENHAKFGKLQEESIPSGLKLDELINGEKSAEEVISTFFGSINNIQKGATAEQAEKVLNKFGKELSITQKDVLKVFIKIRKNLDSKSAKTEKDGTSNSATAESVSSEVVSGSSKNLGFMDFLNQIGLMANNGDTDGSKSAYTRFTTFLTREKNKYKALEKFRLSTASYGEFKKPTQEEINSQPHLQNPEAFSKDSNVAYAGFAWVIKKEHIKDFYEAENELLDTLPSFGFINPDATRGYSTSVNSDIKTGEELDTYAKELLKLSEEITPLENRTQKQEKNRDKAPNEDLGSAIPEQSTTEDRATLQEEVDDTGVLLNILGIEGLGEEGHIPTSAEIIKTMNAVIEILKSGTFTEAEYKKVVATLTWIKTSGRTYSKERLDRATKRVDDGRIKGEKPVAEHYNLQLLEELVEVLVELDGNSDVLTIQKAALKILRFGPNTIIKDGANKGKTNAEVYTAVSGEIYTSATALLEIFNTGFKQEPVIPAVVGNLKERLEFLMKVISNLKKMETQASKYKGFDEATAKIIRAIEDIGIDAYVDSLKEEDMAGILTQLNANIAGAQKAGRSRLDKLSEVFMKRAAALNKKLSTVTKNLKLRSGVTVVTENENRSFPQKVTFGVHKNQTGKEIGFNLGSISILLSIVLNKDGKTDTVNDYAEAYHFNYRGRILVFQVDTKTGILQDVYITENRTVISANEATRTSVKFTKNTDPITSVAIEGLFNQITGANLDSVIDTVEEKENTTPTLAPVAPVLENVGEAEQATKQGQQGKKKILSKKAMAALVKNIRIITRYAKENPGKFNLIGSKYGSFTRLKQLRENLEAEPLSDAAVKNIANSAKDITSKNKKLSKINAPTSVENDLFLTEEERSELNNIDILFDFFESDKYNKTQLDGQMTVLMFLKNRGGIKPNSILDQDRNKVSNKTLPGLFRKDSELKVDEIDGNEFQEATGIVPQIVAEDGRVDVNWLQEVFLGNEQVAVTSEDQVEIDDMLESIEQYERMLGETSSVGFADGRGAVKEAVLANMQDRAEKQIDIPVDDSLLSELDKLFGGKTSTEVVTQPDLIGLTELDLAINKGVFWKGINTESSTKDRTVEQFQKQNEDKAVELKELYEKLQNRKAKGDKKISERGLAQLEKQIEEAELNANNSEDIFEFNVLHENKKEVSHIESIAAIFADLNNDINKITAVDKLKALRTLETREVIIANQAINKDQLIIAPKTVRGKSLVFASIVASIYKVEPGLLPADVLAAIKRISDDLILQRYLGLEENTDLSWSPFTEMSRYNFNDKLVATAFTEVVEIDQEISREAKYTLGASILKDVMDASKRIAGKIEEAPEIISGYLRTVLKPFIRKGDTNVFRTIPNFIKKYDAKGKRITGLLKVFTEEEQEAVGSFVDFAKKVDDALVHGFTAEDGKKILPLLRDLNKGVQKNSNLFKLFYNNIVNEKSLQTDGLYTGDSSLLIDPNMRAMIAASLYEYLGTRARADSAIKDKQINTQLGRNDDDRISEEEREIFKNIGTLRTNVEENIGGALFHELGLSIREGQPGNTREKMAQALGQVVVLVGLQMDVLEERVLETKDLLDMDIGSQRRELLTKRLANNKKENKGATAWITTKKLVNEGTSSDTQTPPTKLITDIEETLKKNPTVFKTLFSIANVSLPLMSVPGHKAQGHKILRTIFDIPKRALAALNKQQQVEHRRSTALPIFTAFSDKGKRKMLGYTENVENGQRNLIENKRSVNSDIERTLSQLETLDEIMNSSEESDPSIYYEHEMTSSGRMDMRGSFLNIQQNKDARFLIALKAHRTTISTNRRNNVLLPRFYAAVAEGMALKDQSGAKVDSLYIDEIISLVETNLSGDWAGAISIIQGLQAGRTTPLTTAEEDILLVAVELGKERVHSLQALTALASYATARDNGATSFETDLGREVDGVNNGVFLSYLSFGLNDPDLDTKLRRAGMHVDNTYENMVDYRKKNVGRDIYQDFAVTWSQKLNSLATNNPKVQAVMSLVGDFTIITPTKAGEMTETVTDEGRSYSKDPVMVFIYGASPEAIARSFVRNQVESIYTQIDENINNPEALLILQKKINKILTNKNAIKLTEVTLDDELKTAETAVTAREFTFSKSQLLNLERELDSVYAPTVEATLNEKFSHLIKQKELIGFAYNDMFKMFNAVLEKEQEKAIKAKKGVALTSEELNEIIYSLESMLPKVNIPFTDVEEIRSTILVTKDRKEDLDSSRATSIDNVVEFRAMHAGNDRRSNESIRNTGLEEGSKPKKQLISVVAKLIMSSAGHQAVVKGIHSLDASIIMLLIERGSPVLNIFDAHISGIAAELENNILINNAIEEAVTEADIVSQTAQHLASSIQAFNDYVSANADTFTNEERKTLFPSLKITTHNEFKNEFLRMKGNLVVLQKTAKDFAIIRKKLFDDLRENNGFMSQYDNGTNNKADLEKGEQELTIEEEDSILENAIPKAIEDVKTIVAEQLEMDLKREVFDEDGSLLGSKNVEQFDPTTFNADTIIELERGKNAQGQSHEGIFNMLGSSTMGNKIETEEHSIYLRDLVKNISRTITEPMKILIKETKEGETWGVLEKKPIVTNDKSSVAKNIYISSASGAKANGIVMSNQETYVHEIVHAATENQINQDSVAKERLVALFNWAKDHITPESFLNNRGERLDPAAMEAATARYNMIFDDSASRIEYVTDPYNGTKHKHNRNNHLHEFLTLGVTNRNMMNALSKAPVPVFPKETGATFLEMVFNFFNNVLSAIGEKYLGITKDQTADLQLQILAQKLADNDFAAKTKIVKDNTSDALDTVVATALKNFIVAPLVKFNRSKLIREKSHKFIQGASLIAEDIGTLGLQDYITATLIVRRRAGKTSRNFVNSFLRELRGSTPDTAFWHQLVTYSSRMIDQTHKTTSTQTRKVIISQFLEKYPLTRLQKTALNKVFLKTDFSVLVSLFTNGQMEQLLDNPKYLEQQIRKYENNIKTINSNSKISNYYINATRSMANFMVYGKSSITAHGFNAKVIANLYASQKYDKKILNKEEIISSEKEIDILGTLYALRKTDRKYIEQAITIMRRENARTDTSGGINFILGLHNQNKKDSLEKLFQGNPLSVIKGFTKDIYDPNVAFTNAPLSSASDLHADGFVLLSKETQPMLQDPDYPQGEDKQLYMYVNTNAEVTAFQAQSATLNQEAAFGSDILHVNLQANGVSINQNPAWAADQDAQAILQRRAKKEDILFNSVLPDTKPSNDTNLLMPILDLDGKTSGLRYGMNESTKDNILMKDNDFDTILGKMEANILDKLNSRLINEVIVRALKKEHDQWFANSKEGDFIKVSEDSKKASDREIWRMMPEPMRQEIINVWGSKEIFIRDEIYDLVFGRRKFSLADHGKEINAATSGLMNHFGEIFKKMLRHPEVRGVENVWQQIIGTTKDIIVVKTGLVLFANIISNVSILLVAGVSIKDIAKHHTTAIKHSRIYLKDSERLAELGQLIKTSEEAKIARENITRPAAISNINRRIRGYNKELREVNERLATNPVRELNESGVYQTIVEDLSDEDEQFSYKSKLANWADPVLTKVPSSVKTATKHLFMLHDTPAYKFLRDATQLSDFVARYTLHKHNMGNKNMTGQKSIEQIIRVFINYDLPTHRGVQYANDMGFIMFTKFAFRIQRVILETAKGNPGRALALFLLQHIFGEVSDIYDTAGLDPDRLNWALPAVPINAAGDIASIAALKALLGD